MGHSARIVSKAPEAALHAGELPGLVGDDELDLQGERRKVWRRNPQEPPKGREPDIVAPTEFLVERLGMREGA